MVAILVCAIPIQNTVARVSESIPSLLDLGFLVDRMFACDGIKFPDFHLVRHIALVFRGGVEMTGTL